MIQNLSFTRTLGNTSIPTYVGLHSGMDSLSAGGIEICATQRQFPKFTPSLSYRRRMLYGYKLSPTTDQFRWYVAANGTTPNMR